MSSHLLGKYRGNSAHVNFFLDSAALTRRKLNSFPVAFKFFPFQNFMQYGKLFHISATRKETILGNGGFQRQDCTLRRLLLIHSIQ